MKRILLILFLCSASLKHVAQDVFFKDALKANREKQYRNLVNNTINSNLSLPLTDSTEENWQDAFAAMELINYRSPWAENKIRTGIDHIRERSFLFQRVLLEFVYTRYPQNYLKEVRDLLKETPDTKIFAICVEYLFKNNIGFEQRSTISEKIFEKLEKDPLNPILLQLNYLAVNPSDNIIPQQLDEFLQKNYLPGNVLLISFQRKNRDLPGLVMVRDTAGNFIKKEDGSYFTVPQLARSITNLPGYMVNGNTPEGIFRMDGFDHSKSSFIGPTTNVQLTMPFEFKASHFFKDSTLNDSTWDINLYKKLLPGNYRNYFPLLQSYYAGKAGRTEIIAHGTTVNPDYYKGTAYYPLTPTLGCLCTKEIWDGSTGKLLESDQQQLANAIVKAGGPYGYAIVINIDDKQEPVSINDIIPFLKLAGQN